MIQSFEDLDEAVAEYLERRRFANTLECFRSEIRHHTLLRYATDDRIAATGEYWASCSQLQHCPASRGFRSIRASSHAAEVNQHVFCDMENNKCTYA